MAKQILLGDEARHQLLKGVNVLTIDSRLSPPGWKQLNAMPEWNHSGVEEIALVAEPVGDFEKMFRMWDVWGWHRVTFYGDLDAPVRGLAEELGWRVVAEA